MNEEPQFQPPTGSASASTPAQLTVAQAADAIGVDSFTMLSFIQRGKVNPVRSPSGEVMVPEGELTKVIARGW